MSELYFIIDGKEIKLSEEIPGIKVQEFYKPPANQLGVFVDQDGNGAKINRGTILQSNTPWVDLLVNARDLADYHLIVEELDRLIFQDKPYFIWSDMYPGRRFCVTPIPFERDREYYKVAKIHIEFDLFKGYAESRGTTVDPFMFDAELWQVGMGLPNGEDIPYIFTSNSFRVFNAGNIVVDAAKLHELSLVFSGEGSPIIQNLTNGDEFIYTKVLKKSDVLVLDGVHSYLNNLKCGRDTNFGYLKLQQGWNQIQIKGCTNINIVFAFRYLYK